MKNTSPNQNKRKVFLNTKTTKVEDQPAPKEQAKEEVKVVVSAPVRRSYRDNLSIL